MNQEKPEDYLLASGETHTIKEFLEKAFKAANIQGNWTEVDGDELSTKYYNNSEHKEILVKINPKFYRPNEVELLMGNPSETMKKLDWKPMISFDSLVTKMVVSDINEAE